jgi:hypothetical protein
LKQAELIDFLKLMIAGQCFTSEWQAHKRGELGGCDPVLLEKTIHAFALLDALSSRGFPKQCGFGPRRCDCAGQMINVLKNEPRPEGRGLMHCSTHGGCV